MGSLCFIFFLKFLFLPVAPQTVHYTVSYRREWMKSRRSGQKSKERNPSAAGKQNKTAAFGIPLPILKPLQKLVREWKQNRRKWILWLERHSCTLQSPQRTATRMTQCKRVEDHFSDSNTAWLNPASRQTSMKVNKPISKSQQLDSYPSEDSDLAFQGSDLYLHTVHH